MDTVWHLLPLLLFFARSLMRPFPLPSLPSSLKEVVFQIRRPTQQKACEHETASHHQGSICFVTWLERGIMSIKIFKYDETLLKSRF